MPSLRLNIIANFIGRGWTAIMGLAFVPLYIKFMGIEAYGLVGFSATIQALSSLLDMGLSTTLNRELARLSAHEGKAQESRDLVRTLEVIYWGVAIIICVGVAAISPLLAYGWIKSQTLSPESIQLAIILMGVVMACQFPFSLYTGGLLGLQRQVLLNGVSVAMATLRGVGMILVLWLVSPTIQAFFIWQACISIVTTALGAFFLWSSLPKAKTQPKFRQHLWFSIWKFAAGMTGISIVSIILMQTDKIILSKLISLEEFGYYNLAGTVSSGLLIVTVPIFTSVFPRFSQIVAQGDEQNLIEVYHKSCQILAVVLLPIAVMLSLFSKDILLLWTGNSVLAEKTHLLVSFLTIGTACNGLMNVPYAMQLAYGWTKLAIYINIAAISLLIPLLFWLTNIYGAVGAASIWAILNVGYVLIGIRFMHLRLLKKELARWYLDDVIKPLFGAMFVPLIVVVYTKYVYHQLALSLWFLCIVSFLSFAGSIFFADSINSRNIYSLYDHVKIIKSKRKS
jgi:O-antigen/teichoic acid export membrane protein